MSGKEIAGKIWLKSHAAAVGKKMNEQMLTSKAHICLCPPIILFCFFLFFFFSAMLINTSTEKHRMLGMRIFLKATLK